MFTLPNFCRVCLKYDKNLIDLAHIEKEPSETLLSKLQLCVSEVDWTEYKPLLCHPCIKRLNNAHAFIKQTMQSASALKNYVELVRESQKKNETPPPIKAELATTGNAAFMLVPNQKYLKILVGSQNQANTYQNVFLNLIPATTVNSSDKNQNVFSPKFVPIAPNKKRKVENIYSQLIESKTEELSVELDPTDFAGMDGDDQNDSSTNDDEINDYEDVLSGSKIDSTSYNNKDEQLSGNEEITNAKNNIYGNYIPILPKEDFSKSGEHFLSSSFDSNSLLSCNTCQMIFASRKLLKQHNSKYHTNDDFKCEICASEFYSREDYEKCVHSHREADAISNSLTLQDFTEDSTIDSLQVEGNSENGDFTCPVCKKPFSSATGLLRHKVRKHQQKTKKKYFIKGMKNAKCDICNRDFSTQSYMQMHRKLHMRADVGYKNKVFPKSKYDKPQEGEEEASGKIEAEDSKLTKSDEEISGRVKTESENDTEDEQQSDDDD